MNLNVDGGIPKVDSKPKYKWRLSKANSEEFTNQIERDLPPTYEQKSARKIEKIIRKVITKSAHAHIGKKKVGLKNKPWLTKEIRAKIKERNEVRKNITSETRGKWLSLCREVNDAIREEKTQLWHKYVSELDMTKKPKEVWRTIRNLDGKCPPAKNNEALIIDGDAYTADKDKANEFAKTYKSFSILPVHKEDRKLRRAVRKNSKKSLKHLTLVKAI